MANADAKARRSKVKDEKQSPAPDELRFKGAKKKRQRGPWVVICPLWGGKEFVWHRAATEEAALDYVEKLRRSFVNSARQWRVEYRGP